MSTRRADRPGRADQPGRIAWLGRAAWLAIAAITAAVQFIRGAWIDGVFFVAAVLALALDRLGTFPAVLSRGRRLPVAVVVPVVLVLLVVLTFAPMHGIVAGVTVVSIGVVVLALAWPDRPRTGGRWSPGIRRSAVAWSVVGVVTCLWELAMFLVGTFAPSARAEFPALSDLLDAVVIGPLGQGVFAALWLGLGVVVLRSILFGERER